MSSGNHMISLEAIGRMLLFKRIIKHPYLAFIHLVHVSAYIYMSFLYIYTLTLSLSDILVPIYKNKGFIS